MVFLRALFVFKHRPFTVQSYFLMFLLLLANPFQFSENYFLVFFYLCHLHSSVLACGMWIALHYHPPLPQGDKDGNESEAHSVSIGRLPRLHLNEFKPLCPLIKDDKTEV